MSPVFLITIILGLVRAFHRHAQVLGLLGRQRGQLDTDLLQVQARHLFIQLLGKSVHANFVRVLILPQIELCQRLVGEAVAHHEARVARGAAQVHQPSLGQDEYAVAGGERVHIHLRLDVGAFCVALVQPVHLDLVVEMPDVAHNRLVLHLPHVFQGDDLAVAGAAHVDIAASQGAFNGGDFEAFHGGLQRIDGVDLGDDDARAHAAQRMRRALAHIAVPADHRHLARYHDVSGALDAVGQRFAPPQTRLTTVEMIAADLHFRGFSKATIHPQRTQPESFDYARVSAMSMWNPTPGNYTRYGAVDKLLAEVDDRLVIMGSGDEVQLRFRAAGLPELPVGWKRDFLLLVDGWA